MNKKYRHPVRLHAQPAGFTLVEMLVSVTLVLLMMTMFASIFSMATDSVSKQRGISQNDQRARAMVTVIRSDFQQRTNRYPFGFYPGENSATSPTAFGNRAGYIYISTNDRYSGLDDLIQFTVNSDILIENTDDTPHFGKARMLADHTGATLTSLSVNPNQPEADDGSLLLNSTSSSNIAEVTYFVRRGALYRRVVLLRKPLPVAGQELDAQPRTSRNVDLLAGPGGQFLLSDGTLSNDFWRFFDFAAIQGAASASLLSISAISNEPLTAGAANESLGKPQFRFGFNQFTGLSREHTQLMAGPNRQFIGRFTHAETSAVNFNWPQGTSRLKDFDGSGNVIDGGAVLGNGNPFDIANIVALNAGNGVVSEFDQRSNTALSEGRGGERRMEELLLANVHEMKIEIWDERLQKYTTPGHSETFAMVDINGNSQTIAGDFHQLRRFPESDSYGPLGSSVGVFDTWHPDVDLNGDTVAEHPPHIAYRYYPPQQPNGPTRTGLPAPTVEVDRQTRRADNRGYWEPNTVYQLGDVVFVPWIDAPNPVTGALPDGVFQYREIAEPKFQIAYRCVRRTGSFSSAAAAPRFPTAPGRLFRELNDELEWESFDNRRPLSSIRMTLRFMDQSTDTQRQLSLIIPLTDKK